MKKRIRYQAKEKRSKTVTRIIWTSYFALLMMFFPAISFWSANMISNIRVMMLLVGIVMIVRCAIKLEKLVDQMEEEE